MKRIGVALVLLAGCTASGDGSNNQAPAPVDMTSLTGLYEGGLPATPNQMCMIENGSEGVAFGITVWGANLSSCSGSGKIVREGEMLRLEMAGDQPCTIEARGENGSLAFPASVPESCAYYCGNAATFANARFEKKGGTMEDAMKATDLVGEPLCAGVSP